MSRCRSEGEGVSRDSAPFPVAHSETSEDLATLSVSGCLWLDVNLSPGLSIGPDIFLLLLIQQDGGGSFSNPDLLSAGVTRSTTSRRFARFCWIWFQLRRAAPAKRAAMRRATFPLRDGIWQISLRDVFLYNYYYNKLLFEFTVCCDKFYIIKN